MTHIQIVAAKRKLDEQPVPAESLYVRPKLPREFAPRVVNKFGTAAPWRTRWKEMIHGW